jgi:hypothetical protein
MSATAETRNRVDDAAQDIANGLASLHVALADADTSAAIDRVRGVMRRFWEAFAAGELAALKKLDAL